MALCKYCIVLNTKGLLFSSIYVNIVLFSKQRYFVFKHLCKYCIVLDTHKGVMTSNDVREECLECHMTSNDVIKEYLECHMTSNNVRGECYIIVMMGRCAVQTEPVGCYENTFISNFTQLCK